MKRFCPKCGQQLPERGRFCRACGAPIPQRAAAPAPVPVEAKSATAATAAPRGSGHAPPPPLPAATATVEEEHETPPPPPEKGLAFTWHRAANGAIRRADEASGGKVVSGLTSPAEAAAGLPPREAINLPPAPAPWAFREQTSAWAETAVARLQSSTGNHAQQPVMSAAARLIRAALLHRAIYRDVAQRHDLNNEAYAVGGAIIIAGLLGTWFFSITGLFSTFGLKLIFYAAVIQAIGWACALFGIQAAAKSMYQLELPVLPLFRGLIYAQAPLLLAFVPVVGGLTALWALVCTVAAMHDLSGRKTGEAIVLTLIGAVAAGIGSYIVRMVLT